MMKGYMLFVYLCIVYQEFYYTSAQDVNECEQNQCKNGGTCTNGVNMFTCNCDGTGYSGTTCETVRYLGQACSAHTDCSRVANSQCSGGKCSCLSDYYKTADGSSGICTKRYLGQACSATPHCSLVANSQCSGGVCSCQSGYFKTADGQTGRCEKRSLGETCDEVSQCSAAQNVQCTGTATKTCNCNTGFYTITASNLCLKRYLGESCTADSHCSLVTNGQCSIYVCSCQSDYYQVGNGQSGSCTKRYLGESCTSDSHCSLVTNGQCSIYVCSCQSDYYQVGNGQSGSCTKRHLDQSCTADSQCTKGNSECRSGKCLCRYGYYQTGTGSDGTCTRQSLGDVCIDSSQCSTSNAECSSGSGTRICECRNGYYDTNGATSGGSCMQRNDLGAQCSNLPNECAVANAACLNSKCTCGSNHYDKNGFDAGGSCESVSNLQVSNIVFSSIQTDNITVTWAIPQNYRQNINRFKVTWRPTNNNNVNTESEELGSSSTSYTMTRGIDPGRAYTVTIISINDQTQQGSQRTTSVVGYQAAKPSITSAIDDLNSDKDISGGTIKVAWINAPGYKSGYIVKLKDGETVKFTRTVNGVSVTFSFSSGLKNGYNYDVTIQAKSEQYNGKTELGEIFTAEFKTTAKLPEPPRNGECKVSTDSSISLDWEAPANPNGVLVQYNIHVFKHNSLVFKHVTSTGTQTDKIVGNLEPGTSYTFRLYTVNEVGQSTTALQVSSTNCKTRYRMSSKPENLQITDVSSRSFLITWDKPLNTYSAENFGYVLQVKDNDSACREEVLYQCSDCEGNFQVSKLSGLCDQNKQPDFTLSKAQLASQLSYNASLNPDINYTVTVTAINNEGRGHPATLTQRTKEEAPQTPYDVTVVSMTTTTFDITWSINGPRPGHTIYVLMLTADSPAESKNFTATGFALRQYTAFRLQEYWNYSVTVMASTSVGSSKSAVTNKYRTSPAAPGKVSKFSIEPHPDEDFTKMKISWEMPTILERNGVIKSYRFENYEPGNVTATTNFQQNRLDYTYTKTVLVVPEEQYTFRVFAINEQNMEGEHIMVTKMAPPGVPLNIEESLLMDVIDLQPEKTVTEKQITISLVREFFEESTNGKVQITGLVVCVNSCDFEGVMTIIDVNAMETWTGASKKGLTSYRATKSDWLDRAKTQCSCGRNKREVTNIEYIVGNEDCTNVSPDEFCNGPLQPGTSYKFVAFTCTNGGCLFSRQYGPFTTTNADSHCSECYTTNTHAVIVGVVLGLIIIILLLYAGYATYLIRRYRAKDEQGTKFKNKNNRKSQTYVNETFMTGSASNTLGNINVDSGVENVYSRLDDNSREDKTTYESLRP